MTRILPSLLLLAPAAAAQTTAVSPSHFAVSPGNSYETAPLGDTRIPYRFLQVHDDMAGRPMTIHGLSFRRDDTTTNAYAAYNVIVDVFLSNAATTAATASATFDSNHGSNRVQAAAFKVVSFPATQHAIVPEAFAYRLPLDTPFVWDGQGSLCWEVRLQSRTNAATNYFDSVYSASTNPYLPTYTIGTGCRATGYTGTSTVQLTGSSQPNWPGGSANLTYTAYRLPSNSLVLMTFGTSTTSFFGVPLPFELPTTASAPSGACSLYNSLALSLPGLSDQSGTMNAALGVPATPELNGGQVFAQVIAPDAAANPIGFVTSNTIQHSFLAPFTNVPVSKVELPQSLAATGTRTVNNGLVVKFD